VYADVQDLHQAVRPSLDRRLTENAPAGFVSPHRLHTFASSMSPSLKTPTAGGFSATGPSPELVQDLG
jgi:hypothetical protein